MTHHSQDRLNTIFLQLLIQNSKDLFQATDPWCSQTKKTRIATFHPEIRRKTATAQKMARRNSVEERNAAMTTWDV